VGEDLLYEEGGCIKHAVQSYNNNKQRFTGIFVGFKLPKLPRFVEYVIHAT
jgi:hypothetical protein